MRAVFFDCDFISGQKIVMTDDSVHHLNVVRVKEKEKILLINGRGYGAEGIIISLTKKEVIIHLGDIMNREKEYNLSVAIACPKKDAFEDIVKLCTEMGVTNIYPLESEFSQYDYSSNARLDRIIESALVQSNNFFLPHIFSMQHLESFLSNNSKQLVYFSSRPLERPALRLTLSEEIIVLIGPEAGFSEREENCISSVKKLSKIHLPTPIMRAPTAVGASLGYLLAQF